MGRRITAVLACAFLVTACNPLGESKIDGPLGNPLVNFSPPGSFVITAAAVDAGRATISWAASAGAVSYILAYGTTSGAYPSIFSSSATSPTTVTGLTAGQTYYFMVTAVNSAGALHAQTERAVTIPSLSLDFLSGTLHSGLTYARAGGATRINSSGVLETLAFNAPRFDYDPITLAPKGILLEEARTNLLILGEVFESSYWTKTRVTVTANAAAAPDGTSTADKLVETASNGQHYARNGTLTKAASALKYTYSIYAKAAGRNKVSIWTANSALTAGTYVDFTLAGDGVASTPYNTTGAWTAGEGAITKLANGWYRLSVTSVSDTAANIIVLNLLHDGTSNNYMGDGVSGVYLWGAQLEQAGSASSYIPTRNILQQSQQIDNAYWTKTRLQAFGSGSVANSNATTAPDGTNTAEYIVEDATANVHQIARNAGTSNSAAQNFALSFYAKKGTRDNIYGVISGASGYVRAFFDLTAGTVVSSEANGTGSGTSASIVSAGNGWYRCVVSGLPDNAGTTVNVNIGMITAHGGALSYAGDGVSGLYLWGPQLELGSAASTYMQIVSNAVRGADSLAATSLGAWYAAGKGGWLADYSLPSTTAVAAPIASFSDGTAGNAITLGVLSTGAVLSSRVGGVAQSDASKTYSMASGAHLAATYNSTSSDLAYNSVLGTTGSSAALPAFSSLQIGAAPGFTYLNGYLETLRYFPVKIPTAALQQMSAP